MRVVLAVLPSVVALVTVVLLLGAVPASESWAQTIAWFVAIGVASFVAASIASQLTTRLLPLAALLRMSLVFPDQAPSRLKLAIKASSRKRLKREVESARHHGLSTDATEAAEQILLLTAALGEHDRRTRGHSERVRLFTRLLGEEMGVRGDDLDRLQWGALLHDVGKLTIPTDILNKPDRLDQTEWAIMAGHAQAGRDLVAPLHPFLGDFVSAADGHHEKWDGSGYPLGLTGKNIPLAARIVAVADSYEVMTATRAYKKPMSAEAARAELTACAGSHFDPDVVRAWLNIAIGDVRRAAGPAAFIGGLPLLGELVSLIGRTATHVAAAPAAAAAATPAAATAGAMTMALVVSPPPLPSTPDMALDLIPTATVPRDDVPVDASRTVESSTTTTAAPAVTTTAPLSSSTVASAEATTTTAVVTTTAPPSTVEATTTITQLTTTAEATTTTTEATTTTQQATTTTAPPSTTTTAPTSTTTTPPPPDTGTVLAGAPDGVSVQGAIPAGADLTPDGDYGGGTHLFLEPAQTLASDLVLDDTTIPAGTTVCVHTFITFDFQTPPWFVEYDASVLGLAGSTADLEATDALVAGGVDYGDSSVRGIGPNDDIGIVGGGFKAKLKLRDGDAVDTVRILVDCG